MNVPQSVFVRERSILGSLPDAIIVIDADGDIEYVNPQAERVFGFHTDELVGEPVEVLISESMRELHRKYRRAYVARPHVRAMGLGVDLHGRRKDGTTFAAEISLSPLKCQGRTLYCAAVRDVSETRRSERTLRALLEATPDALVIVDQDGCIVSVNVRVTEFFGYLPDELIGQPVEVLLPERFASTHETVRAGFVAAPHARPIGALGGLFARRKDGTEFPADISLAPVETDEGLLVSAAVRDVSDRVAAQREVDRLQQEFFATVSHELRTPLTSILGYVELLADLEELSPQGHTFLQVIHRNAKRERRLVDDLLTLVGIQESGLSIRPLPVDLASVVSNAVQAARPQAVAHEVDLDLEVGDLPAQICADPDRIGQAVDNLLSNAIKFTPPGGHIHVHLGLAVDRVHIDVSDTGSGVQPMDVSRIFDRAYRAGSAISGQVPGAGLGLTIARAIAEAHDGSLTLVATSDRGTTFRIELPLR